MKARFWVSAAVVVIGVFGGSRYAAARVPVAAAVAPAPRVDVWLNTSSGVYHCPGTRYFGSTKSGRLTPELEARAAGYRPAGGTACSETNGTQALFGAGRVDERGTERERPTGRVWVNAASGVYHCAGSRYFGRTKSGKMMAEAAARAEGGRPAGGVRCDTGRE